MGMTGDLAARPYRPAIAVILVMLKVLQRYGGRRGNREILWRVRCSRGPAHCEIVPCVEDEQARRLLVTMFDRNAQCDKRTGC